MSKSVFVYGVLAALVVGLILGVVVVGLSVRKTPVEAASKYGICGNHMLTGTVDTYSLDVDVLGGIITEKTEQQNLKLVDVDILGDCLLTTFINSIEMRWMYAMLVPSGEKWMLQDVWYVDIQPHDDIWPIIQPDSE